MFHDEKLSFQVQKKYMKKNKKNSVEFYDKSVRKNTVYIERILALHCSVDIFGWSLNINDKQEGEELDGCLD